MKNVFFIIVAFIVGQLLQLVLNFIGSMLCPMYELVICLIAGLLIIAAAYCGLMLGLRTPLEDNANAQEVFEDEDTAD